jgi:parvulin-like peptidyl-prolyl isomerase
MEFDPQKPSQRRSTDAGRSRARCARPKSSAPLACGLLAYAILVAAGRLSAQQAPAQQQAPNDDTVVATVDGDPIRLLDVKRQIASAIGSQPITGEAETIARAQALEQVIHRRLIAADFLRRGVKPTPAEEAAHDQAFAAHLTRIGKSRDDYLNLNKLTDDDLKAFRTWDILWNRYIREQLTDERLQKFYDAHRRDYDGTELRVSHILLRVQGQGTQANAEAAITKALGIRQAILAGTVTFAEAARQNSDGPSREQGGDLGFIPRRERQGEAFSAAAFRLKKGELSPPVLTPFGIHLITVTDEKPGQLTLKDVREQIARPAAAELFHETGRRLRTNAKVDYTGAITHFDPTTGRLVQANR